MPDIFICHASEDKEEVARPLAELLSSNGIEVWYDEYSLKLGESLRRSIDKGLAESKFGAVIISSSFFAKKWPQTELDGLFSKEINGQKTILPVWHKVDRKEVLKHSPILADRWAAKTEEGLDIVMTKILNVLKPDMSHLTLSGKTLSVTPKSIRLHTGDWAVKTPLRIFNLSNQPAYSVQVKLSPNPPTLDSKSVRFESDRPTTIVKESFGSHIVTFDIIVLCFIDSKGKEAISLIFHTIDPKSSREVQVEGTLKIKSSATVELWDFKEVPPEVLKKEGDKSFPLQFPENVKLKSLAFFKNRR